MASTIKSSDLDFNNIKANLTAYFRQQSEFADYDFEASGLSNILDVLAYNTHMNGLIANFALNETFLNSAQLRSSVVSHAEMLGYSPRSKTASRATVNLSMLVTDPARPNIITIPAFTKFNTSIDGSSYQFQIIENYIATDDGSGGYTFVNENNNPNLEIAEGIIRTKTFIVGDTSDQQVYVIPDKDIDTSTVSVNVYDTTTSTSYTVYSDLNKAIRINESSLIPNNSFCKSCGFSVSPIRKDYSFEKNDQNKILLVMDLLAAFIDVLAATFAAGSGVITTPTHSTLPKEFSSSSFVKSISSAAFLFLSDAIVCILGVM